jgi:hypothetical protein
MDLQQYISGLTKLPDDQLEKISQECSKKIVFSLLDGEKRMSKEYIDQCETLLAEFRKRILGKIETDIKKQVELKET